ncbi:hypothetical protein HDF24_01100 [Mucilaginibacter sp. X4EP1]|jgi:hypothetical protein|uniref:hypothetical protein n=1 Tax=Mucilaginibacter sp. X4EP1 TaxID=2723092 RepID=UPI0021698320|nr:hypothetical protein [Mucilaginibacter sp. X4EP1]MCS3811612.1 hypothetical protein [Mucilaginibacter sp. X4EP1]
MGKMAIKSRNVIQESTSGKSELKKCFIITPIGESNSETNRKAFGLINAVMKPILEKYQYEPIAASDISSPGSINKQILIRLYEDELVIANLTGLNPNVMYELAVRHAVKKIVIIMAEKGTKLPFDLVDQRCIFYEDTLHDVEITRAKLDEFLSTALTDQAITNPIYDSIKEDTILKTISGNEDPIQYVLARLDKIEKLIFGISQNSTKSQINDTSYGSARFKIFHKELSGEMLLENIADYLNINAPVINLRNYIFSFDNDKIEITCDSANDRSVLMRVLNDVPSLSMTY